jgi:hypothetical protein
MSSALIFVYKKAKVFLDSMAVKISMWQKNNK